MIRIIIQGGLGNQLFQIATAISLNDYSQQEVGIVATKDKLKSFKYFNIKYSFKNNQLLAYILGFQRRFYKIKYFQLYRVEEVYDNIDLYGLVNNLKNGQILSGTFSSTDFFYNMCRIKESFVIKQQYQKRYFEIAERLNPKGREVVAIHIRRTDYRTFGNDRLGSKDLSLPANYYHKAIQAISNIKDYKIVVVGDDLGDLGIDLDGSDTSYTNNDEIVDFQILMNANIIITANSTFSWWASFLSRTAKRVLLPEYWLGFHVKKRVPGNIFNNAPDNWEIVEF